MCSLLLIAALSIVPQSYVPCDYVERLELNNFYDENGRLVFTQLLGWESNETCRFWRMAKTADMQPHYDHAYGGWTLTWSDGEVTRQVRSRSCGESWTQADLELVDREKFPKELRRELKQPNFRKGR